MSWSSKATCSYAHDADQLELPPDFQLPPLVAAQLLSAGSESLLRFLVRRILPAGDAASAAALKKQQRAQRPAIAQQAQSAQQQATWRGFGAAAAPAFGAQPPAGAFGSHQPAFSRLQPAAGGASPSAGNLSPTFAQCPELDRAISPLLQFLNQASQCITLLLRHIAACNHNVCSSHALGGRPTRCLCSGLGGARPAAECAHHPGGPLESGRAPVVQPPAGVLHLHASALGIVGWMALMLALVSPCVWHVAASIHGACFRFRCRVCKQRQGVLCRCTSASGDRPWCCWPVCTGTHFQEVKKSKPGPTHLLLVSKSASPNTQAFPEVPVCAQHPPLPHTLCSQQHMRVRTEGVHALPAASIS